MPRLHAPAEPTTAELKTQFPFDRQEVLNVQEQRIAVASAIRHPVNKLNALGPCALTDHRAVLWAEGDELASRGWLQRNNYYKPRTNPNDWHGLETGVDPSSAVPDNGEGARLAYKMVRDRAVRTANVAAEIGYKLHAVRYGEFLTFGWLGSRNEDAELVDFVAKYDPALPIGIKNGLDGEIDAALGKVDRINTIRSSLGAAAVPAVLIYRGGLNAQTPEAWEEQALIAIARTEGKVVLDMAHGGEMAHDPTGYRKSVEGQIACLDHAVELREEGHVWAGTMIETTSAYPSEKSPTDPPIPFDTALEKMNKLS